MSDPNLLIKNIDPDQKLISSAKNAVSAHTLPPIWSTSCQIVDCSYRSPEARLISAALKTNAHLHGTPHREVLQASTTIRDSALQTATDYRNRSTLFGAHEFHA
jgi:hypothetical protein